MREAKKAKASWWQVTAAIAAVLVAGAVARTFTQGAFETGQRVLTPQSDVEARLDEFADTDPFTSSFRQSFPSEWTTFRSATAAEAKSSMTTDQLKVSAATRMRSFMIEHVEWTASAPVNELNQSLSAEKRFVDQLASDDIALCARYGMTGLRGSETLSPNATRLMNEVAVAKLIATRSGRDNPQKYGEPTAGDVDALIREMRTAGASDDVINLVLMGGSNATPDQQCSGIRALYSAMDELPDEQAARVFASILRGAATAQKS